MPDETHLLDMLAAARKALRFVEGLSVTAFSESPLHQSAVVKQLEIIGEAASRVSQPFRDLHPDIPWRKIIGMRHRLVHDYTRIDIPTVWETTQNDLPSLIARLESLVPPEEEEPV